ncbi:MAG: flagellar basal body-associated protein FliL [Oxalobacter sp.]|nr:MAG: flagellar basal body-associated protein FliL [Oxalobacter sp.]
MATKPQNTAKPAPPKGAPEEVGDDAPKPKKSKKKIIFLLIFFLLLAGGGGGAWWYFMGNDDAKDATKKVDKAGPPIFLSLEQFTLNLQPEGVEHYLQVSITLQVASKDDVEQIKLYMPQIRSRILLLLTSKKASEIGTLEGKKKLVEEIKAQVNLPVTPQDKPQTVVNVFFTSFVIQ